MGVNNMLVMPVYLKVQPASGIRPELHLKKGSRSIWVDFYILDRTGLTDFLAKRCVIKGTLPDGRKLFLTGSTYGDSGKLRVRIATANVMKMCAVPGTYTCTLTILNTNQSVSERNFMDYDMLTLLPFTVIVDEAAGVFE